MVLDALIWAMVLMIFCTWCSQFTRYNLAYEYLCFPPPAFQALACLNNEIRVVCGWCNSSCCTHLFGVDVFCITWIYLNAYVSSVTYVWRTWEHICPYVPLVTYVCMAYTYLVWRAWELLYLRVIVVAAVVVVVVVVFFTLLRTWWVLTDDDCFTDEGTPRPCAPSAWLNNEIDVVGG